LIQQFADGVRDCFLCPSLYVEVKMEAESSDERDGDKSAAFTVLLHGSLKVEQMVALVQLGSVFIPF